MSASGWRRLGGVSFAQLYEARMQAHYAAQWLARFARAYIPPLPDDVHTNLGWDNDFDRFTTHPLTVGVQLGLRLPALTLVLLRNEQVAQSFPLERRTDTEVRVWLGDQIQALDLSPAALDAAPPYRLSAHPLADGACYDATALVEPLSELAAWYANGFDALNIIRLRLIADGLSAPAVRCWPHHFDLDCLTRIENGAGKTSAMDAGFSPGDHYYKEPYFYISLHPRPDIPVLPHLHGLGHWHVQDFLAAIAPASRIVASLHPQAETEAFLCSATDEIVKVLRGTPRNQTDG
jgi:hypothetical protein